MNIANFLCIDDQKDDSPESFILTLESYGNLKIDRKQPVDIGNQIEKILSECKNTDNFGLLLDLRLDMEAGHDGTRVPYRGPTLAQELRTRMAEDPKRKAFPIILWSINTNFVKSFQKDDTSHDLFDAIYSKDLEIIESPQRVAREMHSLACGYEKLNAISMAASDSLTKILGRQFDEADPSAAAFVDHFRFILRERAKHEVALHLMGDLIKPTGLLVGEALMAARLGVAMDECGAEWEKLKERLAASKYLGPFGDAWERWWWPSVETWWNLLDGRPANLRRTGADKRVDFLNTAFKLELVSPNPIAEGYSTKYFTLCVATNAPLDPVDGLRVATPMIKPWEDPSFVSINAALNRINRTNWRIDPLEADRFSQLKS